MLQLPAQFQDDEASLRWLAKAATYVADEKPAELIFDARRTTWIDAHMCAGLVALKYLAAPATKGRMQNLTPKVQKALTQNGFLAGMAEDKYHTTMRLRRWRLATSMAEEAADYLTEGFVRAELPGLPTEIREPLLYSLCEVFSNVERHSQSQMGCLSCGQHYPQASSIRFSICDLGVTIPVSVQRSRPDRATLNDAQALDWAMQPQLSTVNSFGGMGLPDIADLVTKHGGVLRLLTGNALYLQDGAKTVTRTLPHRFPGTFVVIAFPASLQSPIARRDPIC